MILMMNFKSLNLSEPILLAIRDLGFTKMTPVQERVIPLMLKMQDLIVEAETGTGKTAAFSIPLVEKLRDDTCGVQALVLCPTRELVIQVNENINALMKHLPKCSSLAIYGGQNINTQLKALKKLPSILVATPGRLLDHLRQGSIRLNDLRTVILDEADKMLEMGFKEDLENILRLSRGTKQIALFSATMPSAVLRLAHKYQKKAEKINLVKKKLVSLKIDQKYIEIKTEHKIELLKRLLFAYKLSSVMIFCNTKLQVDKLYYALKDSGFSVANLHGDLKQNKRDAVMRKFRESEVRILIATDLAARGIDVDDIEAVINFTLPREAEDYVHRIGRTARAGKSGYAFTLLSHNETKYLKELALKQQQNVEKVSIPKIDDLDLSTVEIIKNTLIDSTLNKKTVKTLIKKIREINEELNSSEAREKTLEYLLKKSPSIFGSF